MFSLLGLSVSTQAAVPATERQVLMDLYNGTNGAAWTTHTNWTVGDPCENAWYGIVCDDGNAHVTELWLQQNNLGGSIPDLGGLTSLTWFDVSYNQLSGSIPSLCGLTSLATFRVDGNELSGTPPAAPPGLEPGQSALCSNFLHTPSPTDAAWNAATGGTWSDGCTPGYRVSTSATPGGSIGPSRGVATDGVVSIDVVPDDMDHVIGSIGGSCGGTLVGNTYTTAPVIADCTVIANFVAVWDFIFADSFESPNP